MNLSYTPLFDFLIGPVWVKLPYRVQSFIIVNFPAIVELLIKILVALFCLCYFAHPVEAYLPDELAAKQLAARGLKLVAPTVPQAIPHPINAFQATINCSNKSMIQEHNALLQYDLLQDVTIRAKISRNGLIYGQLLEEVIKEKDLSNLLITNNLQYLKTLPLIEGVKYNIESIHQYDLIKEIYYKNINADERIYLIFALPNEGHLNGADTVVINIKSGDFQFYQLKDKLGLHVLRKNQYYKLCCEYFCFGGQNLDLGVLRFPVLSEYQARFPVRDLSWALNPVKYDTNTAFFYKEADIILNDYQQVASTPVINLNELLDKEISLSKAIRTEELWKLINSNRFLSWPEKYEICKLYQNKQITYSEFYNSLDMDSNKGSQRNELDSFNHFPWQVKTKIILKREFKS